MYMYDVKGIVFACSYDFSIGFWNCSDSVVFVVLISTTTKTCVRRIQIGPPSDIDDII